MNTWYIMHKDRRVARIDASGRSKIYYPTFMPYGLYLESGEDVDTLVNNLNNFYFWCASRVLTLDRQHAKALLNSAGLSQAVTDKERATIALTYRCLSLTDVFWVKGYKDPALFADVNLYENHLDKTFIDIALRGKQYTVENRYLARDLATNGCYPKAWQRHGSGFCLLKDGGDSAVDRELLASRICRCFRVDQVLYEESAFDGERVTISKNFTSEEFGLAPFESLQIKLLNRDSDARKYILRLDRHNYYMMNVIDYLVGNTDRHWGNWGVLVNNQTNMPVRLHDLMDFNQAFQSYDHMAGANCLTSFGRPMTQQEAAAEAVSRIGLNQIAPIDPSLFSRLPQFESMFIQRLRYLQQIDQSR